MHTETAMSRQPPRSALVDGHILDRKLKGCVEDHVRVEPFGLVSIVAGQPRQVLDVAKNNDSALPASSRANAAGSMVPGAGSESGMATF